MGESIMVATASQVEDAVRALADAIGIRRGFYEQLLYEPTDWAFLVQLQVVVEAVIADKVVKALHQADAFEHVARLPLEGKTGKLQLALTLGVLDASSAEAFRALAACRNRFAHRTANLGATLENFGESLDAGTKLDLIRRLGALELDAEATEQAAGFPGFGTRLRHRIWLSTAIALARLADDRIHERLAELQRTSERTHREEHGLRSATPRDLLDFYAKDKR